MHCPTPASREAPDLISEPPRPARHVTSEPHRLICAPRAQGPGDALGLWTHLNSLAARRRRTKDWFPNNNWIRLSIQPLLSTTAGPLRRLDASTYLPRTPPAAPRGSLVIFFSLCPDGVHISNNIAVVRVVDKSFPPYLLEQPRLSFFRDRPSGQDQSVVAQPPSWNRRLKPGSSWIPYKR